MRKKLWNNKPSQVKDNIKIIRTFIFSSDMVHAYPKEFKIEIPEVSIDCFTSFCSL